MIEFPHIARLSSFAQTHNLRKFPADFDCLRLIMPNLKKVLSDFFYLRLYVTNLKV